MREVLIIAYLFPPLGGGGVQRTLGFVRHLPANGWRPTVICADDDASYWARDNALVQRVPLEATVIRVPSGWPGAAAHWVRKAIPRTIRPAFDRMVFVPDRQAPWAPKALQAALRVAATGRFAALYSTGSPWTNHMVAAGVKTRTGLPWIADFRDPWTQNMTFSAPSGAHAAVHRRLESMVYHRADRIVANTPGHMRSIQTAFSTPDDKMTFIPNGYAESDFAKNREAPAGKTPLIIGYAGSFYPGYGPDAVLELFAKARPHAPPFRLRFMGKTELGDKPHDAGIADITEELGYLSQEQMLDRLAECHATILAIPGTPRPNGMVPQKLYMYLRLGRPMIGVLPPGDASELIRQAGTQHLLVDPLAIDGPAAGRWLHRLAAGQVPDVPREAVIVRRYARDVLTQRLAALLHEIAPAPSHMF
ncbi:MAG: glycosyltransferase [Myxococcota bacterium]